MLAIRRHCTLVRACKHCPCVCVGFGVYPCEWVDEWVIGVQRCAALLPSSSLGRNLLHVLCVVGQAPLTAHFGLHRDPPARPPARPRRAALVATRPGGADGKAIELSVVLTPGSASERERIEAAGGWVTEENALVLARLHHMKLEDPLAQRKLKSDRYLQ